MTKSVTIMTLDDVDHYSEEEKESIYKGYPRHEREARAKGIPTLGSGKVFPVPEEDILVEAFSIPSYWPRICGVDFGWDHPAAGAWLAWDRDTDTVYLYHCYRKREALISTHASIIKAKGDWIPIAWPHDGYQHDKGQSGKEVRELYSAEGLKMLDEHAQFAAGGYGLEASVSGMLERMETGKFKVFSHLNDFLYEFRLYHRKDGKIVAEIDDVISATRYALMMLRFAQTKPIDDYLEDDHNDGRSEVGGY